MGEHEPADEELYESSEGEEEGEEEGGADEEEAKEEEGEEEEMTGVPLFWLSVFQNHPLWQVCRNLGRCYSSHSL